MPSIIQIREYKKCSIWIIDQLVYRLPMIVVESKKLGSDGWFPVCPRCKDTFEREFQAFCDRCGQRLNWNEWPDDDEIDDPDEDVVRTDPVSRYYTLSEEGKRALAVLLRTYRQHQRLGLSKSDAVRFSITEIEALSVKPHLPELKSAGMIQREPTGEVILMEAATELIEKRYYPGVIDEWFLDAASEVPAYAW